MIHVHVETFTEFAPGSVLRNVRCERCHTDYLYELARVGKGTGSAVYGIGKEAARKRARKAAEKNLAKRLSSDVEAVPCPQCGWIQDDMVRELRGRRHRTLRYLVYTCISLTILSLLNAGIFWLSDERFFRQMTDALLIPTICVAGLATALHALRTWRIGAYDPNDHTGCRAGPPLRGTPPALMRESDGSFRIAAPEGCGAGDDGVVIVQTARCTMPFKCSVCLGRPDWMQYPPLINLGPMKLPICKKCRRVMRLRWARAVVLMLLAAAGVSGLAAYFIPDMRDENRYVLFAVGSLVLWIIGTILYASFAILPYRGSWIDRRRSVVKLQFMNRDFARLVSEMYRSRVPKSDATALLTSR